MRRFLTRRRVLMALAGGALGAVGYLKLGPRPRNSYYSGPVSDHFDGTRFYNPRGDNPASPAALLKYKLLERATVWPASFASPHADQPPPSVGRDETRVSFIGHASFLVQSAGQNILIDPVWGERASPVSFAGPRRANPPGIAFDALPRINTVLVSHNHYDHLDTVTLGRLWQRHRPRIITPLGNDTIMRNAMPGIVAEAYDWGARVELAEGVAVHLVPSQHWSARGLRDRRHALWASFILSLPRHRLYHIADTGFGRGANFKSIGEAFPGIDLAMIPIGAYEPRWFMAKQHINPDEAVAAFLLSGARKALGHHWGTFQLTTEAIDAPPADLAKALAARSIAPSRFRALRPGEVERLA